eukprot:7081808-Pyramimonas_sp.AAC.1
MPLFWGSKEFFEGVANSFTSASSAALVSWASRANCPDCGPVVNCDCPSCPAVNCGDVIKQEAG